MWVYFLLTCDLLTIFERPYHCCDAQGSMSECVGTRSSLPGRHSDRGVAPRRFCEPPKTPHSRTRNRAGTREDRRDVAIAAPPRLFALTSRAGTACLASLRSRGPARRKSIPRGHAAARTCTRGLRATWWRAVPKHGAADAWRRVARLAGHGKICEGQGQSNFESLKDPLPSSPLSCLPTGEGFTQSRRAPAKVSRAPRDRKRVFIFI